MATNSDEITVALTITATPAAPRLSVKISKELSSKALREKVAAETKIPLQKLRLIYAGKLIKDDDKNKAVSEFRLEEGSVLHCMGQPESSANATAASSSQPAAAVSAGSSVTMPSAAATTNAAASPAVAPAADPLQTAFATLKSSNPPATYMTAVTTLEKILSNIVANPMEEKYRRVKKKNAAFQRRLGGLPGADDVMIAAGFTTQVQDDEEVYMMEANAEKWPQLMKAKTTVEAAVREATAAANQASAAPLPPMMGGAGGGTNPMANFPTGGMPGGMGMNPAMHNAMMNQIMSDPNALQSMLQVCAMFIFDKMMAFQF